MRQGGAMRVVGSGLLALVVLFSGADPVEAQAPELAEVRGAVDDARFPEARELLERWWEADGERADRRTRQEALWLRARLTPDPQLAELDYRRLVIEFPGGPFSDGALLRLAQGSEARGESAEAGRYLEILVRDYPTSEHRVEARDRLVRLERAEDDPPPVLAPPTVIRDDTVAVADTVVREPPPEIPVDPVVEGDEDEELDELTGSYTVQLGAFSTRERAMDLARRADEAGLRVRVVQVAGSELFRVRLGGFESRQAAEEAAQGPRNAGFEALVSMDREQERDPDA
ncbi:MAG: hypothetical protein EA351_12975 [Gemmatimonadales bacterium]|nr:MAG: hypothetical protein EA351_12975 [Gemmatimonadales bacterium]